MAADHAPAPTRRHRPRAATVFIAAFVAGAAAAVGINRVLDVHLAQTKPQVECEPIFVALRSLPQGVPVTVWDVALRDWPKAMMPDTAVRVNDSFAGCLLKHPLREGQPLLTVQLLPPAAPADPPAGADEDDRTDEDVFVPPMPATVMSLPAEPGDAAPATTVALAPVAAPGSPGGEGEMAAVSEEVAALTPAPEADAGAGSTAVAEVSPDATESQVAVSAESQVVQAAERMADPLTDRPGAESVPGHPSEVARTEIAQESEAAPAPRAEPEPSLVVKAASQELESAVEARPAAADRPVPALAQPDAEAETAAVAVRQEPTPAAEPPLPPITPAPTPIAIGPQLLGQRSDGFAPLEVPARAVPDIGTLPSVVTHEGATPPAEVTQSADASVRFLVVPERIAQQADTSFTTPASPTVANAAADTRSEQSPQPATLGQPGPRQPGQAQPRQAQSAGRQAGGQQATARGPNRTASGRSPANRSPAGGKQPQAAQPKPADRAAAESSSWGSMFPNVSAGLEAIGKWRNRGREAVADEPRTPQPRR